MEKHNGYTVESITAATELEASMAELPNELWRGGELILRLTALK